MPQDLTDDKATLVKVIAWCRQVTSHYLSQCWPSPLLLGHNELMQERCNSRALAMDLSISCINLSIFPYVSSNQNDI